MTILLMKQTISRNKMKMQPASETDYNDAYLFSFYSSQCQWH